MIELGQGFPEWTELGQDSGLDPLGMQRPIEAIYQSLLPGVSTITLRFRYYSFFPWILKHYEDHIRHTDPAIFPPPSGDEHSGDRPTAPRSPWQNGYCERAIGSIRRECLDHVVVLGEAHLRRILKS